MKTSLAASALVSLRRRWWQPVVIDRTGLNRQVLTGGRLLAAAAALADELRHLPADRLGIVLPPGAGGWVANLAVALAGKSSVNLNFSTSRSVAEKSIALAGVSTVITAAALQDRVKDFPWEHIPHIIDLKAQLAQPAMKKRLAAKYLQSLLCPSWLLERLWITPCSSSEATVLFSGGSTGTPKGIPLSQRNILANLSQIEALGLLPCGLRMLCNLPLFHSFGLTAGLWYSLTHSIIAITTPSPLEAHTVGQVIDEEQAQGMVGTPSFYQLYLRQIPPARLRSLQWVVAGAEKTPQGLHERWQERMGSVYLEGYGLTETSPVVAVNLPQHNRPGTVGRPVQGLQARVVDIHTREVIHTPGIRGVLEFRGDNVFQGYLGDPTLTQQAFHDDWLWTGDLGHIDAQGYLTVDGRLKRFSKIAGEMIPHGAVEEAIIQAWGWQDAESSPVAVVGLPDPHKGEQLVLLSTQDITPTQLRERLHAAGLPNLWIPKQVVHVPAIPRLASGKLDLPALSALASTATSH